jgi:hypothetical protein
MIDLRCSTCGGDVVRCDRETGALVVCATVHCVICLGVPICINCRKPFAEEEARVHYVAHWIPVGPFCARCSGAIEAARVTVATALAPRRM